MYPPADAGKSKKGAENHRQGYGPAAPAPYINWSRHSLHFTGQGQRPGNLAQVQAFDET